MKALIALVAFAAPLAYAQPNIEAGKAKVATVCAACHGVNGVSVSDTIPNLAAQRAAYLARSLHGERNGSRGRISVAVDIDDHALRFQSQPFRRRIDDPLIRLMRN